MAVVNDNYSGRSCYRVNYRLSRPCNAGSTFREGVKPAKLVDAVQLVSGHQSGCLDLAALV